MNEEELKKQQAAKGLENAALIMGIISLFSTFCCCPFVFSALGIIFALISMGASKKLGDKAKTGLILSIIGLVVSIVISVFTVVFPFVMLRTNPEYKNMIIEQIDDQRDMLEQIYGEDMYEEVIESIENF